MVPMEYTPPEETNRRARQREAEEREAAVRSLPPFLAIIVQTGVNPAPALVPAGLSTLPSTARLPQPG